MLEDLQSHKNKEVYEKAVNILVKFFHLDMADDDEMMLQIFKDSSATLEDSGMNPAFIF